MWRSAAFARDCQTVHPCQKQARDPLAPTTDATNQDANIARIVNKMTKFACATSHR